MRKGVIKKGEASRRRILNTCMEYACLPRRHPLFSF